VTGREVTGGEVRIINVNKGNRGVREVRVGRGRKGKKSVEKEETPLLFPNPSTTPRRKKEKRKRASGSRLSLKKKKRGAPARRHKDLLLLPQHSVSPTEGKRKDKAGLKGVEFPRPLSIEFPFFSIPVAVYGKKRGGR